MLGVVHRQIELAQIEQDRLGAGAGSALECELEGGAAPRLSCQRPAEPNYRQSSPHGSSQAIGDLCDQADPMRGRRSGWGRQSSMDRGAQVAKDLDPLLKTAALSDDQPSISRARGGERPSLTEEARELQEQDGSWA